MEFRTAKCKEQGHQEISLHLAADSGLTPDWLLAYFETEVVRGRKFLACETVQIGWMVTQLREVRETLELWEPRFDSFPIQWVRGVNNTVRHLVLQKEVCAQFECEPRFPSLRQPAVIAPDFLALPGTFSMSRDEPSESDSGWVFKKPGYSGSEGEWRSLFEISIYQGHVIPFLALPVGTVVTKTSGSIEIDRNGKHITSESNKLLGQLMHAKSFV
jgi:hypothetical protein